MRIPLLGYEQTVSYFTLAKNDNIMVKIYDMHVQGLLMLFKVFSAFLISFFSVSFVCSIWIVATISDTYSIIITSVGILLSFLGILTGIFGF